MRAEEMGAREAARSCGRKGGWQFMAAAMGGWTANHSASSKTQAHLAAWLSLSASCAARVSGSSGSAASSPPLPAPAGAGGGALLPSFALMRSCRCCCSASSRAYFCRRSSMHAIRLNCAGQGQGQDRAQWLVREQQRGGVASRRSQQASCCCGSRQQRWQPASQPPPPAACPSPPLDFVGGVAPDALADGGSSLGQPVLLRAGWQGRPGRGRQGRGRSKVSRARVAPARCLKIQCWFLRV